MAVFHTLRFVSDENGQRRKVESLNWLSSQGWTVVSENIEPGQFKGDDACCFAAICLPLAFAAGSTPNIAVVTVQHERGVVYPSANEPHDHAFRRLDDNYVICSLCGLARESVL